VPQDDDKEDGGCDVDDDEKNWTRRRVKMTCSDGEERQLSDVRRTRAFLKRKTPRKMGDEDIEGGWE